MCGYTKNAENKEKKQSIYKNLRNKLGDKPGK